MSTASTPTRMCGSPETVSAQTSPGRKRGGLSSDRPSLTCRANRWKRSQTSMDFLIVCVWERERLKEFSTGSTQLPTKFAFQEAKVHLHTLAKWRNQGKASGLRSYKELTLGSLCRCFITSVPWVRQHHGVSRLPNYVEREAGPWFPIDNPWPLLHDYNHKLLFP